MVFVLMLAIIDKCFSQCLSINLIKNPGLEEYSCCPYQNMMLSCADFWTQPLPISTSEYLNTCALDSLTGSGDGFYYFLIHAHFGNGYAGICNYLYNPTTIPQVQSREYIQGSLSSQLISGQSYYCEFWVKLFNANNEQPFCGIDALGILFSDTLPKKTNSDEMAMFFPAQINNQSGRVITDTSEWTMISDTFTAHGGEQFFTAGTFKQEDEINKIYFGYPHANVSYYFFDNFSLCPCSDTLPPVPPESSVFIPNVFSPNNDGSNDVFYIKGVNTGQLELKIFDRWGYCIFESHDATVGWDGLSHDRECPAGVYFYTATITNNYGSTETKTGNITLVR